MQLGLSKRSRIATAFAAAALCLSLAACSAGSGGSADGGMMPSEIATNDMMSGAALDYAATGEMATAPIDTGRSVIASGGVSLEVDDPRASVEAVTEVVEELGGFVESQNVGNSGAGGSADYASLTVRVPSDEFDTAFDRLAEIGKVLDENRSATDVTAQHVDLQARVKSLETSVARLTELMAGAATTSELIEAESALSARQAELDGLKAQLESLEDQIDESTIWVQLSAKSALPGGPSNFWEGLIAGLESIVAAGAGGLVLLGVLLPWLVIAGVIALLVVALVRGARRRRSRGAPTETQTEAASEELPPTPAA